MKKGFTLIELLVVIAIIGILSGVVLTNLNSARAKAKDGRRISDIKQIQVALELFAEQCGGRYPANTFASGNTLQTSSSNSSCSSITFGQFLSTIPKDPSSSSLGYKYIPVGASEAACYEYHLGTRLESTNSVLNDDADLNPVLTTNTCGNSATDFSGGSGGPAGAACDSTGGTETCFDVQEQ